jgi:hypothetical protein
LNKEVRVFHSIPWNSSKNIGVYYNSFMKLLEKDDWACFLDGDAIHTTTYFGRNIEDTILDNPKFSLFTCYTNRIGCRYQIAPNVDQKNNDQAYHREFGEKIWNANKTKVLDITNSGLLSGVLILIKKEFWCKVGGFKDGGMLGVDNDIHKKVRDAKLAVGLMSGVYVQHWYRGGNAKYKDHLILK